MGAYYSTSVFMNSGWISSIFYSIISYSNSSSFSLSSISSKSETTSCFGVSTGVISPLSTASYTHSYIY